VASLFIGLKLDKEDRGSSATAIKPSHQHYVTVAWQRNDAATEADVSDADWDAATQIIRRDSAASAVRHAVIIPLSPERQTGDTRTSVGSPRHRVDRASSTITGTNIVV